MGWIERHIKWIMLLSGVLTCSLFYAAIDPQAGLLVTFGAALDHPPAALEQIVIRNWGALVGLVGGMLIYGAFHPENRPLVLTVACLSKLTFIMLILIYGSQYLGKAGIALAFDLCVITVFIAYLIRSRRAPSVTAGS